MPSLFSRARTASTPGKPKPPKVPTKSKSTSNNARPLSPIVTDEFGRSTPQGGGRARSSSLPPTGPGEAGYGAVGFLPTTLPADLSTAWAANNTANAAMVLTLGGGLGPPPAPRPAYGLLSPARDAVLGLPDVARLVARVCAELERTGVATPFVFSALALDVRRGGVVRLVNAFLASCREGGNSALSEERWAEEARFAGAHELGMCLRWGLSRVVRVEGGREVRGLLSWAWYERWRTEEAANGYPPTAYSTLLASLPAQLPPILAPLFALCTRLVAHSNASGHTPPSLAAILSPLLFGLTPPSSSSNSYGNTANANNYGGYGTPPVSPGGARGKKGKDEEAAEEVLFPTIEDFGSFSGAYEEYLRGAHASEHLVLAAIREGTASAANQGLGAPTKLREWVGMYPVGVGEGGKSAGPRRGAKTTRVVHVRRNVRTYSADLVRGGSSWASGSGGGGAGGPTNDWAASKAWRAIVAGGAGAPRYAESYRKRLDLGVGVHPSTSSLASSYSSSGTHSSNYGSSPSAYNLSAPSTSSLSSEDGAGAFRSLTDLKWGEFESLGFGSNAGDAGANQGGIETKLKFDLTENARAERLAKRETLSWNDFSSAGFTRSDAPLSATLQFSPPLTLNNNVSANAPLNAELTRKLRKAHKALPAFGWDTQPVLGPEEVVEEAFLDVFCDLLWGGGWMERASGVGGPAAELARECSWALVEYKSRSGGQQDSGSTLVLFEEFVPREYRLALAGAAPPGTRRRLPSLFSPSPSPAMGGKTWKQAQTLNGRPYVLGATPTVTGSTRELDFDSMLRAQGGTKILSLGAKRAVSTGPMSPPDLGPVSAQPPVAMARTQSNDTHASSGESGETPGRDPQRDREKAAKRQSGARFRLPGGMIPGPSPGSGGRVRAGMAPAEYAAVEFETRLAGESDDEGAGGEEEAAKQRRRESASDAWVDILVGSVQARRMPGQDAELGRGSARRRAAFVGGVDPDLESMEAAKALAAETMGREQSPDPEEIDRRREQRAREREEERYRDSDVVEIERVPRASEQSERSTEGEDDAASDGYGPPSDGEDATTPGGHPSAGRAQRQEARNQRRLGYFDLHPERRPASSISTNDDDPRSLLSGADSDDEHDVVVPVPRNLDIRPLPTPTGPALVSPVSPVDVPQFDDAEDRRRADRETGRSKADSAILTPTNPNANGNGNGHHIAAPSPAVPSKTSALIDMFREREARGSPAKPPAGAAPPAIIAPSRLPVRVPVRDAPVPSLSPNMAKPPPLPKTPPAAAPAPLPKTPIQAPATKSSPPLLDPPPPPLTPDSGRASPARYVHGAPLHNVLEEEEEEP
ncbi:hypothetical protein B0H16DRAFT_750216 [Mycena metata]|uniref:Meiotically up-regulated protein Msb1/Mug8 domain-containing protein n=1 Tax=Mycena metata TaxID=1033252 RepID=A0AAD7DYL6_9AGAR|nr:hypothetical protein B0H16DRAFT_750216 [Mycena metata]